MLNYCPISLKLRQFSPLPLRSSHILYYDDKLYFCCSEKSEQDFIENPTNYVANSLAKYNLPIPGPLARLDRGAILEYQGKCPVSLVRGQLENGLSHLIVVHKKKWFAFSDAQSMQQFEHNPKLFKRAHLPDKLPLVFERNKVTSSLKL
jgi:adenylate/nucleoside-diphosphate kinase